MDLKTNPALDYSMLDLTELLNRGFESYFVPIAFSVTAFLNMVRKDGIDLTASRVLVADDEPAGIALIARRGWTSRLAAMGIAKECRGRGLGSWFMEQLICEACERDERELWLEVIEQNQHAVNLYAKYGFQTIRRLIGFIRKDAMEEGTRTLQEMDIREAGRLISQFGLTDLPWQLSGETIALMTPPARAYRSGQTYIVISNPNVKDVIVWSLLVEPAAPRNGLELSLLKSIIAQYPNKTWHVPALLPEELGKVYDQAGFVREELSQWQMRLDLQPKLQR